jgi:hypothetical protein
VRIFLSYASEQADIAENIAVALGGEGHTVFRDRSGLPPGDAYHDRIREAVAESDLLIFLVSPESVSKGRYTITELDLAQQQWSNPSDRVLPVVVRPTDIRSIPAYLKAVTLLEPRGNVPAGVVAAVGRIASPRWRRLLRQWAPAIVILALVGAGFLVRYVVMQRRLASEVSRHLETGRLAQASRNYAAAWDAYAQAAATDPERPDVIDTQERLAMDWVENIRVTVGKGTFTDIVARVEPILLRCAGATKTPRAADCAAHLGWSDYLRRREGAGGLDPIAHYRRAIGIDPQNVYGHAMWGFELVRSRESRAEGATHFAAAIASGRERAYVRSLHFAGLFWTRETGAEDDAIRLANDMRKAGEQLPSPPGFDVARLWTIYHGRIFTDYDLPAFLDAVSPADHVATFQWLFPEPDPDSSRQNLKLFVLATLQEHAGLRADALANFLALRDRLAKSGGLASGGRLPDRTVEAVKRLTKGRD